MRSVRQILPTCRIGMMVAGAMVPKLDEVSSTLLIV